MIYSTDKLEQLKSELEYARQAGKTIGFSHGVFDLMHQGHLFLLIESSKQCDYLVVGVESNDSVKAYKGSNRPIYDEVHRTNLIDSLQFVNATLLMKFEPLPNNYTRLFKDINPDKVFVGSTFGYLDQLHERQKQMGTFEVVVVDPISLSTSEVIDHIRTTTP